MEDEFLKGRAAHIRKLAENADPFIKTRLLDLAKMYEGRVSNTRRLTPIRIAAASFPSERRDER